ncbi:hypothetical protein ZWY2020_052563 [Hordeum vulgare]|nr:hypothetical protein ZWY2020_052563 [Hordeum vulgare]
MLPRLPASLHLRSLWWPRDFSSSLALGAAANEGADGKIVAAVVFERLPVIIPKIHPIVYAFQDFSPWVLISFCSLRKDLQTLLISFCSLAIPEDGAEGGAA